MFIDSHSQIPVIVYPPGSLFPASSIAYTFKFLQPHTKYLSTKPLGIKIFMPGGI